MRTVFARVSPSVLQCVAVWCHCIVFFHTLSLTHTFSLFLSFSVTRSHIVFQSCARALPLALSLNGFVFALLFLSPYNRTLPPSHLHPHTPSVSSPLSSWVPILRGNPEKASLSHTLSHFHTCTPSTPSRTHTLALSISLSFSPSSSPAHPLSHSLSLPPSPAFALPSSLPLPLSSSPFLSLPLPPPSRTQWYPSRHSNWHRCGRLWSRPSNSRWTTACARLRLTSTTRSRKPRLYYQAPRWAPT